MARSRSLPRDFLKDPDVMELKSADHRLILIGLVLNADDEGRGQAHHQFLACELGYHYTPEQIDQALTDLEAHDLVQCYQVGRHRYYQLPRWLEWETLSKPTRSKYPAPPSVYEGNTSQEETGLSQNFQGHPEKPREVLTEEEEEEKGRGSEEERKGEEETHSTKVVPIPTAYAVTADAEQQALARTTTLIARILKLSENEALCSLVREYMHSPDLSLEGEAYSAREWIDDRSRNRKGSRMTPAFFRRWLKREREMVRNQELLRQQQAPSMSGGPPAGSGAVPSSQLNKHYPSLNGLSQRQQAQTG